MKRLVAFVTALALAGPASAQPRCLTEADAEAMALVALPDILRETGRVCAAQLPPASLLHQPGGDLIGRYQAEADRAWPVAKGAIVKLSDPTVEILLQSEYARPLIVTTIVPLIVGRIATQDCGTIDRMVTLLAPLPPRNTAGVVVATLRYLKTQKARGKNVAVPDLPLCAEGR